MTFVLPGDPIVLPPSTALTFGPGIAPVPAADDDSAPSYISTRAGLLCATKGKAKDSANLWVEGAAKRYVPAQRDIVLGTVIARHADGYRVDLGSAHMASLDALAFEGATKRSKPNLKVGTLLYARVSLANRDMEPEIECVDPATGKAEGFGELKGGVVVECSLQLCRQLLSPKFPLLPHLATHIPFETAIGLNGRVWVKTADVGQAITIKRVIERVGSGEMGVSKEEVEKAVKELL